MKNFSGKYRMISLALAIIMLVNAIGVPVPVYADYLPPQLTVTLYSGDSMPNGAAESSSAMLFTTYLSEVRNPNDEITLAMNAQLPFEVTDSAVQLGTATRPFAGTIRFNAISEANFTTSKALFAYVSTDAQFLVGGGSTPFTDPITITRILAENEVNLNSALFADHVVKGTADSIAWNLRCLNDGESNLTYAGVFGEIGAGAEVDLTFANNATNNGSSSNIYSQGNVGLICGTMAANSTLELDLSGTYTTYSVTSDSGAAGGLVGVMHSGSRLVLNTTYTDVVTVTASGNAYVPLEPASDPEPLGGAAAETAQQETAPAPASETPASETPAAETPVTETPAAQTPAAETPAAETPAAETPVTETPAAETPAAETPATETPAAETPATETPAAEAPAAETPAAEAPASETSAAEPASQPAPASEPAPAAAAEAAPAGESATVFARGTKTAKRTHTVERTPENTAVDNVFRGDTAKTPAVETPAAETPATETPATETPATETPAAETPAAETPATETPVTETPAAETPATETPAAETPATETPAEEKPAAETPEKAAAEEKPAIELENEKKEEQLLATSPGTYPEIDAATLKSGYAGGIVGWAEDAEIELDTGVTVTVSGTVIGKTAAGGVYGYYHATEDRTFALDDYTITATLGNSTFTNARIGGVFGMLVSAADVTVTDASFQPSSATRDLYNIEPSFVKGNCGGGLIGYYDADTLGRTLLLQNLKTHLVAAGSVSMRAGLIGRISDHPAYVECRNVGAQGSFHGGLVGNMGSGGSFLNVCEYVGLQGTADGGIVSYMNQGVLRLQGITHLHDTTNFSGALTTNYGQLVRQRGDGLVYAVGTGSDASVNNAAGTGWKFYRAAATRRDDIYDWGEVLRLTSGVITEDLSAHTVEVGAADTSMGTATDFAKTALNIQLNVSTVAASGALRFAAGSNSTTLLSGALSLTNDISLSGTGLTGFTRDDGTGEAYTGTFSGNNHAITLAIGEIYGLERGGGAASESGIDRGAGRIYMHKFSGLFAMVSEASFSNLTVDGTVNTAEVTGDALRWNIGGIAANSTGNLTLDNCSVGATFTDVNATTKAYVHIGGAIGTVSNVTDSKTITISDGTYAANIIDKRTTQNTGSDAGGVIGYVNCVDDAASCGQINIDVSDVTLGGSFTNTAASDKTFVQYGGLIGCVRPNTSNAVKRLVTLQDVTVADLNITMGNNEGSGGLLGYIWYGTDVVIGTAGNTDGLTIGATGNDSASPVVNFTPSSGNPMAGGLVFGASGHWIINHLDAQNVTFNTTAANADFGFTAARGVLPGLSSNPSALYLEIAGDMPTDYDLSGVKVTGSGFRYFDEIVAYTVPVTVSGTGALTVTPKPITDNGAAVVSMHTTDNAGVAMSGSACNTYQNQTAYGIANGSVNANARYYYNLDLIRAKASPSDAEKLLLWSLYRYGHSTIRSNFTDYYGSNVSGSFDMTGVTYYPVSATGVKIRNSTIKFYNEQFEQGEQLVVGDGIARSSRAATQHDLFHCGILYDANNITASNLTLQGTVGAKSDGSGFLVRGRLHDSVGMYTDVSNITLDNALVRVGDSTPAGVPSGYAPVLINKVGSSVTNEPTNLTVTQVKTTNYAAAATAGSSLIGDVEGLGIQLTFTDMRLDARTGALANATTNTALKDAYGTTQSIFTRATLLNSFIHTDSASDGRYNYNLAEDWSGATPVHHVTYGKEISGSSEYSGITQNEYFDQVVNTNPDASDGGAYGFNTASWLRYVYTPYDSATHKHELRINQKLSSFEDGCGKYDDPYQITDGSQLVSVAQIIRGDAVDSSFKLVLPDSLTPNTAHTASGAGSQANDKTFTYNSGTGNFESGGSSYTFNAVREYLAGAYYSIAQDITIPDTSFTGLGAVNTAFANYSCAYAFRGVILGNTRTIHNLSSAPLIANSNGCVVKDLRLSAEKPYTFTQNKASNNTSLIFNYYDSAMPSFYGPVIGKVMGGDTFIDNVNVSFDMAGSISGSGTAARLVPIGGYIGVLVNGGVIFRNMPAGAGEGTDDVCSYVSDSGYLYANPIIGRVLMGYAFSEGCTVDNGTKNYQIPQLNPSSSSKLTLAANKNVNVPDGQALWVLGAAINSGAAAASNATAAYNTINNSSQIWSAYRGYTAARMGYNATTGDVEYNDSNYGSAADGKLPYLLRQYTSGDTRTIGTLSGVKLNITGDCVVPVGFRGIGNIYNAATDLQLQCATVDGGDHTVVLDMRYQEYDTTNAGENYKATANVAGFGMINSLRQTTTASDLTISGSIFYDIRRADDGGTIKYAARTGNGCDNLDQVATTNVLAVGGLSGISNSNATTFNNVNTYHLTLEGACFVGGILGKTTKATTVNDCGADTLTIRGGLQAGGLIGMALGSGILITLNGDTAGSGDPATLEDIDFYCKSARGAKTEGQDNIAVAGGLIGMSSGCKTVVSDYKIDGGQIKAYYPTGQDQTSLIGGCVGMYRSAAVGTSVTNFTMNNVNLEGPFAAGITGETYQGNAITLNDITITGTPGVSYIRGQRVVGGLIAMQRNVTNLDTCTVSGYDIYMIPGATQWERNSAGGLYGWSFDTARDMKNIKIEDCRIFTCNASNNTSLGGAGGLMGRVSAATVTGSNILIHDTEISNYASVTVSGESFTTGAANSTNYGYVTGWKVNADNIKLAGISVIDVTRGGGGSINPIGTVGSTNYGYGTNGYAVFADFDGAATELTHNEDNSMFYSSTADLAAEMPYVTVNPSAQIDASDHLLTSDGVASSDTDMTIRSILSTGSTRYALAFGKSGLRTDLASRLSTFKTECAISDSSPDVGVFVIEASTSYAETTALLNSYLDLLTNTDKDYFDPDAIADLCSLTFTRMELTAGDFVQTSTDVSMEWDQLNTRFAVKKNMVDNNRDSFTLLDVAFYDPHDTTAPRTIAYHLYVPILVKKVLEFQFSSYVLPGTTYRAADYTGHKQVLENFGTTATVCFSYTYGRTAAEWIQALENGDDLTGNYAKSIILSKYDNVSPLPAGTKLALVDAKTGKAYYKTLGANFTGELALNTFVAEDGVTPFEPVSLSELLQITSSPNNAGAFVRCDENDADALATDTSGNTYKLYTEELENPGQRYSLSAGVNSLTERYYLSIFTNTTDPGIARYVADCAKRLPDTYPTLCVSNDATKRSDIILGRVYTITTTLTTSGGDAMNILDRTDDTITANLSTNIQLNDGAIYRDYVGSIYHSFLLHLTRTNDEGSRTAIVGDPTASGTYSIDGSAAENYTSGVETYWTEDGGYALFTASEDLRSNLTNPAKGYATTITATVMLDYNSNEGAIEDQFPVRPTDPSVDTTTGTTVFVKSNIASTKERTEFSSTSNRANDSALVRYFSGLDIKEAVLSYNTLSATIMGDLGELGVNPLDQDVENSALINTLGALNFRDVERQSEGYTHLRVAMSLSQKSDSYGTNLNFSQYFDSMQIAGVSPSLNTTTVTLLLPKTTPGLTFSPDGCLVTIPIDFYVKTGTPFEAAGKTYSNYKVTLDVDLVQVENDVETLLVNARSNYIIYTNARVVPDFIS